MDRKTFDKILGDSIKRMREDQKLTQAELSALMNINSQNISSYERGERSPSLFWIGRLCSALGVEPIVFMEKFYKKLKQHSDAD